LSEKSSKIHKDTLFSAIKRKGGKIISRSLLVSLSGKGTWTVDKGRKIEEKKVHSQGVPNLKESSETSRP